MHYTNNQLQILFFVHILIVSVILSRITCSSCDSIISTLLFQSFIVIVSYITRLPCEYFIPSLILLNKPVHVYSKTITVVTPSVLINTRNLVKFVHNTFVSIIYPYTPVLTWVIRIYPRLSVHYNIVIYPHIVTYSVNNSV